MSRKPKPQPAKADSPARRRTRQARHLSQSLMLEEAGPPWVLAQFIALMALLVVGAVVWAAATEISETTNATGQIMPAGTVKSVQHLEGGIVAEVLVSNGEFVEAGQPLIRLQATASRAELEQLQAREIALALRAERLRAFVMDREPDFAFAAAHPELVEDQRAILEMQQQARVTQGAVLNARVAQRKAELAALAEQRKHLEKAVEISNEQLDMRAKLLKKGLVSRVIYLETERALNKARGDLASVIGKTVRTTAALSEAESSILELDSSLRNDALTEMGGVTAELAEVREAVAKLQDRVDRLEIRAPTRGVVKGLATRTVGAVVAAGEPLAEIVPINDELVAEVQISPRDVGHLRLGSPAQIKVTSFDVAQFGSIAGELTHVSASTFEGDDGAVYYKGVVRLAKGHVGADPERNVVLPGMVVDVGIETGSRSLLRYLLKPIYRALDGAFGER